MLASTAGACRPPHLNGYGGEVLLSPSTERGTAAAAAASRLEAKYCQAM